jgi:hypothetical protein
LMPCQFKTSTGEEMMKSYNVVFSATSTP